MGHAADETSALEAVVLEAGAMVGVPGDMGWVQHCASWEKETFLGAMVQDQDQEGQEGRQEVEDQLDQRHWASDEERLDKASLALVSGWQVVEEHVAVADERSHVARRDSTVGEALEGHGYQPTDDSTLQRLPGLEGQDLGEVAEDEDPTVEQPVHEWRRAGKPVGGHLVALGRFLDSVHRWMVLHSARAVTGP